ncbi:MAG: biotin synthase BioB [Myxococcales bacterium]|nr:biotin synthase BioB [Myxococcales bacterium]MDD9968493.1 biotin synthase BioB [Myxococcales bacterium]
MHDPEFYDSLARRALADEPLSPPECEGLLCDPQVDLLPLLYAAYRVRTAYFGKRVQLHIINNAQNGLCPEDCGYCSQAKTADVDIEKYPIKGDQEILDEARRAYEAGAHRYCMVFSGRGPNTARTQALARLVRTIKANYKLEVCVSAGLVDDDKARMLAEAGLDRLNHNLNTAEGHYEKICTTHSYADRLNTIRAARNNGLEVCSGMIVGMGEQPPEVVEVAHALRELGAASIPINFLLPFEGTPIAPDRALSPDYCLRVLCMFRLVNPRAELRIAAGRELHLRALQPLGLYPANSLFLDGYLNSRGDAARNTLQMIRDAGFSIESDQDLGALLADDEDEAARQKRMVRLNVVKRGEDLRPTLG